MAARATTRLVASTILESIVGGAIDVGAATPVVAPLCVALQKAKAMIDGVSRNKEALAGLLKRCGLIAVHVIDKVNASENSSIDVSPLVECVDELKAVAERNRGRGRCTQLVLSCRHADDIQRLSARIEETIPTMTLSGVVDNGEKLDRNGEKLDQISARADTMDKNIAGIRLQLEKHALARKVKVPGAAPRIQSWYVLRKAGIKRACDLLGINGESTASQEPRVVGLVGPGGAGKSTMASMVLRDLDVRSRFHKGVMWLSVGKGAENHLCELMFRLATMVWRAVLGKCARPPEKGGAVVKPDGGEYIRERVDAGSRRSFLVVADDVWEGEVLAELRKAGVWVLYTSRRDSLSEPFVWLDTIDDEEAKAVLRGAAKLEEDQPLPDAVNILVEKCNGVMDLAFVGSWSTVQGRTDPKAWQEALDNIAEFHQSGVSWRTAVLHAGYEYIGTGTGDAHTQKLYLYLAVLPKGLAFAENVAAVLLYGKDFSPHELAAAMKILATLERFSVLVLEDGGKHRVHDEHADFVREKIESSPQDRNGVLRIWREYAGSKHAILSWTEEELVNIWREIDALHGTGVTPRPFALVLDAVEPPEKSIVLDRLLSFYDRRRQPAKALRNAKEMLALEESELGPQNPRVVPSLVCAGKCARLAGLEDEADAFFQRARAIQEHISYGSDEETRELATIEDDEPFLEQILAVRLESLRRDHPNIAVTYCQLGVGAWRARNAERAERCLQKALQICEMQGVDSIESSRPLHWLGLLCLETERITSAVAYLERALEIREMRRGPDHPDVADTVRALGQCAREAGREQEAVDCFFFRALRIREYFEEPAIAQAMG